MWGGGGVLVVHLRGGGRKKVNNGKFRIQSQPRRKKQKTAGNESTRKSWSVGSGVALL